MSDNLFQVTKDGKSGFINDKEQVVIDMVFDDVSSFSEGLARIFVDDKVGFIDIKVNIKIQPKFDTVSEFSESMAYATIGDKYGYIDTSGNFVIAPKFYQCWDFANGYALVMLDITSTGCFIDKVGAIKLDGKNFLVSKYSEGLINCSDNGHVGQIRFQKSTTARTPNIGGNAKNITIMIYNILNGDSLAYSFPDAKIEGDIIVVREALIDGNLSGNNLQEFWQSRAKYMGLTETEYHSKIEKEFQKIMNAPDDSEFNLWFEYDLFCQVNMWFVISIINSLPITKKVFAVYTTYLDKTSKQFWNGFGRANSNELKVCYADRIPLSEADINFGQGLWDAYKNGNLDALTNLSKHQSLAFPYLQEVVKAHVDRFPKDGTKGRPEKVIEDITNNISTDFNKVFKEFWNRESIYGFGDTQLKSLYDKAMHHR